MLTVQKLRNLGFGILFSAVSSSGFSVGLGKIVKLSGLLSTFSNQGVASQGLRSFQADRELSDGCSVPSECDDFDNTNERLLKETNLRSLEHSDFSEISTNWLSHSEITGNEFELYGLLMAPADGGVRLFNSGGCLGSCTNSEGFCDWDGSIEFTFTDGAQDLATNFLSIEGINQPFTLRAYDSEGSLIEEKFSSTSHQFLTVHADAIEKAVMSGNFWCVYTRIRLGDLDTIFTLNPTVSPTVSPTDYPSTMPSEAPTLSDIDGDGVLNINDQCPDTAPNSIVLQDGPSVGCSLEDLIGEECDCYSDDWKNHGGYVKCAAHKLNELVKDGSITSEQKDLLQSQAAETDCGK